MQMLRRDLGPEERRRGHAGAREAVGCACSSCAASRVQTASLAAAVYSLVQLLGSRTLTVAGATCACVARMSRAGSTGCRARSRHLATRDAEGDTAVTSRHAAGVSALGRAQGARGFLSCMYQGGGGAGLFESRIARIAGRQKAAIRAESRGA